MDSRHSSFLRVVTQQSHWGGALRDDLKNGCKCSDSKVRKVLEGRENILHTSLRPPPSSHVEFSLALGCLVRTTIREENQRLLSAWLLEVEVFMSRHKVRSIVFAATFLLIILNLFCLFCSVKSRMLVKFCLQNCHP